MKRKSIYEWCLYTFFIFTILCNANISAQITDSLELVWSDEFEGIQLDETKWLPCPEWKRQDFSFWEADNYQLTGNGELRLEITQKGDSVLCGAIRTKSLYAQKFGYFEVRCKVPSIKGGWCAFWMMPDPNIPGDEGRGGTEIDVFETINGWSGEVNDALHWDGYGEYHQSAGKSMQRPDLYDDTFHTFGVWWTPTEYVFYIDGVETWRTSAGGISQVEQYLKLTMEASGASWAGNWSEQEPKPVYWDIDYVRAYKSKTLSVDKVIDNNDNVKIYPNPSKDFIIIEGELEDLLDYKIINMSGQVVLKGKMSSSENKINIATLPPNLYLFYIGKQSFKFIKE